jgi:MFS family permease
VRGRLHGWHHPAVLSAAALSIASGFAQFGVTTALPDVAREFGEVVVGGTSLAAQAGLSATTLGVGLAVIRLASLAALPLSGLADTHGRRRVLLGVTAVGLALTASSALSPGYWWFVALIALGRPLLSTTNALTGVIAAEETRTRDRAWALGLVTAGYGLGAGLSALVRGAAGSALGFRELFALCLLPLLALPLLARVIEEPARFHRAAAAHATAVPLLRRIPRHGELGRRLRIMALLYFCTTFLTGPANTFLFLYGENVLGMPRSTTAIAVLAVAPVGLLGLLAGRWLADRAGRLPTAAALQVLTGIAAIVTYSGTQAGVLIGYFAAIGFGSGWGPATAALSTELFPTSIRSTVAGALTAVNVLGAVAGLVVFGLLGDALASFGLAAWAITVPVLVSAVLYLRLPETRDLELEQSAPE